MNLSLLGGSGSMTKYRTFLAEQKKVREELVNLSQEPLIKLKDDLASMMHQVSLVTSGLRRFSVQRDRLKEDVLKEEKYVGIAQRNSETGVSGFPENNATTEYFLNKLLEFDVRMRSYKQELEILEEHVNSHSRSYLSPKAVTTTTTAFQFNTSATSTNVQKPLFGFGNTAATTVAASIPATATIGALSLAGQSMKTQLPSSGFTGLGSTSSPGESLFGKRLASKPTSLALPKT
ncbi:uncharacterized protein DEA37_0013427 [Paragonimus westermani]|uniref:Nucleoporin p58/p45 n=1 Tax=Paragonimus westermani TaxID=34504 RepID=A0A5J4NZS5_9TREM|nr:uncharacterized protein DEA37_0013427 [Paragonimus westermani]